MGVGFKKLFDRSNELGRRRFKKFEADMDRYVIAALNEEVTLEELFGHLKPQEQQPEQSPSERAPVLQLRPSQSTPVEPD